MANRIFSILSVAACLLFFPDISTAQLGVGYRMGGSAFESSSVRNSKKSLSVEDASKNSTFGVNIRNNTTPRNAKSNKNDSSIPYSKRYRENYEEILLRKNLMEGYAGGYLKGRNMQSDQGYSTGNLANINRTSNPMQNDAQPTAGDHSSPGRDSQWVRMMIQPPYPFWIQEALRPPWPLDDSSVDSLSEEESIENKGNYLQFDLSPTDDIVPSQKEESSSLDQPSLSPENPPSALPAPAPSLSIRDSGPILQLVRQGDALFQRRQYREAAMEYGSAALHFPQAKPIAVRLAFAQFANGQYSQAGKTLQKAMDQTNGLPLIKQTIGEIYATDKDFQYQLFQLAKQAQTSPDEDSRYLYRALLMIR